MTTRDKTGDKLVASIRKTKAGVSQPASTPAESKPPAAQPDATATAGKSPRRAPAKPKPTTATRSKVAAAGKAPGDAYQSAGRVWPD